ncbi:amino acid ABC transporter permease [Smaragdicoccus niigatensis]|uniref:amino acid ABC transporter permease n=1 Tax=Smaragdicoccus niigatensis TaxID=359359 RepID=UPI00037FB8FE|nr:amino acid ABC transporter permease [Smaragdicoccus niigatensis]
MPEPVPIVPLRRPGRWIGAAVGLIGAALVAWGAATNPAYDWPTYWRYLFDARISAGALTTLELTVTAMAIGIGLGLVVAVMRLSGNPVLGVIAWLYVWVFRGTPVYVQLVFWGLFPSIYRSIDLGVPFGPQFVHLDIQGLSAAFMFAFIGLGLNEAAYMAEIFRAGVNSVGIGQLDAATALGMSWLLMMRRIVLPQAMRLVIPPTGNEIISMLKTTSLVTAVPLSTELYGRAREIYGINFRPIPLMLVAATWYLAMTSVLMVGQHFLERRYQVGRR